MTKRGLLNLLFGISVLILVGLYVLMGYYYQGSFSYGTWINGVYCTGKTVDEVNDELKRQTGYSGVIISSEDNKKYFVDASAINYHSEYKKELERIIASQNPLTWGVNFFTSRDKSIIGEVSFDEDLLRECLDEWDIFHTNETSLYEIKRDENGYYLVNNDRNIPVFETFYHRTKEALLNKEFKLDLSEDAECYRKPSESPKDEELKELYTHLDAAQNKSVKLDLMGENFYLTKADLSEWIVTLEELEEVMPEEEDNGKVLGSARKSEGSNADKDKAESKVSSKTNSAGNSKDKKENANPGEGLFLAGDKIIEFPEDYQVHGNFVTDKDENVLIKCDEIYNFISKKANEYTTENCISRFRDDGNSKILVSGNKDGVLFDVDKEYTNLLNAIKDGVQDISIPVPAKSFEVDGAELGDEYILVDMGNQHLSYYKDGKLSIDYDIVTGNTSRGRGTPVGLFHVYNKRYHTVLRGVDYASYVNYWLGVNKGIGIHDATWRSKFGDEIYKTNGSHGCINSPLEKMEILYNEVEVGVPVLMFY